MLPPAGRTGVFPVGRWVRNVIFGGLADAHAPARKFYLATLTATRQANPPMKLKKKIALTAIVPAAVAGTAVSGCAAAGHTTHHQVHQVSHHQTVTAAKQAAPRRTASKPVKSKAAHSPRPHHHHGPAAHAQPVRPASAPATTAPATTAPATTAPAAPAAAASPASLTSGMSAFEKCVAWRESGDNPTASSAGMFGILPATWASLGLPGTAGQASVAAQEAAFSRLYAQYGEQPWSAYDGC